MYQKVYEINAQGGRVGEAVDSGNRGRCWKGERRQGRRKEMNGGSRIHQTKATRGQDGCAGVQTCLPFVTVSSGYIAIRNESQHAPRWFAWTGSTYETSK